MKILAHNLARFAGIAALTAGLATLASAQTYTEKTLVNFNGTNGSNPVSGVILDAKGNLYGTTEAGGAGSDGTLYSQYGTLFTLSNTGSVSNPSYSNTPNTLASVNFNDGRDIDAGITLDSNGNVFTTPSAGGDLTTDGGFGDGSLLEIANNGTVAAPSYTGSSLNEISTFENATGTHPDSGVTFDSHGNIFIAGSSGGNLALDNGGGAGTIMEYANTGTVAHPTYASTPVVLGIFQDSNGTRPTGTLTIDSHGNLFGTTAQGGNLALNSGGGDGTVFEIKNTGTVAVPNYNTGITTLANFNGSNGSFPAFAMSLDSKGDLFGTTAGGGANNSGAVFEIANGGTSAVPTYSGGLITVASFTGANGSTPESNITIDGNGDLFGTTFNGGDLSTDGGAGSGNVFEIANTGTGGSLNYSAGITPLFTFNMTNGYEPTGNLALDSNGDLFGTAAAGGANGNGVLFELTPSTAGAAAAAPEPATLLLAFPAIGVAGLAGARRRKTPRNS